jgi:hypothetical protein
MFNEVEQMPKSANLPLVGLNFNPKANILFVKAIEKT